MSLIDGYKSENYGASYCQNTIFTLKYFVFNYTIGKLRMCTRSILSLKQMNYLRFNYGIGSWANTVWSEWTRTYEYNIHSGLMVHCPILAATPTTNELTGTSDNTK